MDKKEIRESDLLKLNKNNVQDSIGVYENQVTRKEDSLDKLIRDVTKYKIVRGAAIACACIGAAAVARAFGADAITLEEFLGGFFMAPLVGGVVANAATNAIKFSKEMAEAACGDIEEAHERLEDLQNTSQVLDDKIEHAQRVESIIDTLEGLSGSEYTAKSGAAIDDDVPPVFGKKESSKPQKARVQIKKESAETGYDNVQKEIEDYISKNFEIQEVEHGTFPFDVDPTLLGPEE